MQHMDKNIHSKINSYVDINCGEEFGKSPDEFIVGFVTAITGP